MWSTTAVLVPHREQIGQVDVGEGIPVTDRLPPFGKTVLACSNLAVTYFVAYVSPQDGKWHLSFGDMVVHHVTHWMPLPEMPQRSVIA